MNIYWHKLNAAAKIPTKRDEDAGFDIYTTEHFVQLMPHEKKMFGTGLAVAAERGWWLLAFDRGSTGSRGIHTHCGVIDNGYRGEIFICLCNDNDYPVIFTDTVLKPYVGDMEFYTDPITKTEKCGRVGYYPISKAIAQIIPIPQPQVKTAEADDYEWSRIKEIYASERGEGKLGDSGK